MHPSDIAALSTRFFQPALSRRVAGRVAGYLSDALGQAVTDIDDINQCIEMIVLTPRGSDPQRPTFGCGVDRYIDYPVSVARPYIARDIRLALGQWEPRLDLVQVKVEPSGMAAMQVSIAWQIAADYSDQIFITNLALGQLA
ncbi:MAG: GPW/gp25 family protein [Burkholderia gladioli]